jgi:DNA-binding response OmpR family regulator
VPTVLLVEDDPVLSTLMRRHLTDAGFGVVDASSGDQALRKLQFEHPNVMVLDLMIPGLDGWGVIEQARADGDTTPIIVLSARSALDDKVRVLEAGADDYLVKPTAMRELVARCRAQLRRGNVTVTQALAVPIIAGGVRLDPQRHVAYVKTPDSGPDPSDWVDAGLTVKEFQVLWLLASAPGRVINRDELQQRVWGVPYRPRDRSVDVVVHKIRVKVDGRSTTHNYIQTHYGVGYRFEPTLTTG